MKQDFTVKTESNGHTRLQRNGHDQICPFATALALPRKAFNGVELTPDRMSCGSHCPFFKVNLHEREDTRDTVVLSCRGSSHMIVLEKNENTDSKKILKLS